MSINLPISDKPRVVVIGGGFGGLSIIKHLKNTDCEVILIDKNNYHTFQPLLYQVATSGLEAGSIVFPFRRFIRNINNATFRMTEVKKIMSEEKNIETTIGNLTYDYLVIATGSEANFYGNKELEEKAMVMKTIPNSLDLRTIILQNLELAAITTDTKVRESLMSFVVVGGGPTGVELAGALAELKSQVFSKDYKELDFSKMEVHLIEGNQRLLQTMSQDSSKKAQQFLKKLGVQIWLDAKLMSYDGKEIVLDKDRVLHSSNLLWTAGVKGSIVAGIDIKSIAGNRYLVNEFSQIENSEIFAIGDVAAMTSEKYPRGHPMVAPAAIQQGENVAQNIIRLINKKTMQPFIYRDKGSMATIGNNKAVIEIAKFHSQGLFAWLFWTFVHLMSIVGFRNKLVIFVDWVWNYFTWDKAIRIIIRPYKREN